MAEIDKEKCIRGLEISIISDTDAGFSTIEIPVQQAENILALLKEQEEQKRKWLQNIADNQLSIGGVDPLTEYEQGKWDGLQMAFEILTEERQH